MGSFCSSMISSTQSLLFHPLPSSAIHEFVQLTAHGHIVPVHVCQDAWLEHLYAAGRFWSPELTDCVEARGFLLVRYITTAWIETDFIFQGFPFPHLQPNRIILNCHLEVQDMYYRDSVGIGMLCCLYNKNNSSSSSRRHLVGFKNTGNFRKHRQKHRMHRQIIAC